MIDTTCRRALWGIDAWRVIWGSCTTASPSQFFTAQSPAVPSSGALRVSSWVGLNHSSNYYPIVSSVAVRSPGRRMRLPRARLGHYVAEGLPRGIAVMEVIGAPKSAMILSSSTWITIHEYVPTAETRLEEDRITAAIASQAAAAVSLLRHACAAPHTAKQTRGESTVIRRHPDG
jgi:hypothetical protein